MSNTYRKVFESWELEDRSSALKQFDNRKKASDKRFYKRQASKAVRRYNAAVIISSINEEDDYDKLMLLKAALTAKRDMLIDRINELDAILASLPI